MKTSDLTRHAVRVRTVQSTARGKKTSHAAAKLASYFRNKPPLGYIHNEYSRLISRWKTATGP